MYLATVSEDMVSPSETVDIVWHLHLIFTKNYESFCNTLGKKIDHIPSTHDPKKEIQFQQAKKNTQFLYRENFGMQPEEIWFHGEPFENPHIVKSRINNSTILILSICVGAATFFPLKNILYPVFIKMNNPAFLLIYIFGFSGILGLFMYLNRKYFAGYASKIFQSKFYSDIHPDELIYMKRNSVGDVIQFKIDRMIKNGKLEVDNGVRISVVKESLGDDVEEKTIIECIKNNQPKSYPVLIKMLAKKPAFVAIGNSSQAIQDKIAESKNTTLLYLINVIVFISIYLFGLSRLVTGIEREKPVVFLIIFLVIMTIILIFFLSTAISNSMRFGIVKYFTRIKSVSQKHEVNEDWTYFLLGNLAMNAALLPLATRYNSSGSSSDSTSTSGCSSDGGSSCGGGGCGGCGGGD